MVAVSSITSSLTSSHLATSTHHLSTSTHLSTAAHIATSAIHLASSALPVPSAAHPVASAAASACLTIRGQVFCHNNITQVYPGGKPIDSASCTIDTCSLLVSHWGYLPNIPSNAFFIAVFALLCLINIPLGIWKKTWGVLVGITIGCVFEAAGTYGRIAAAKNPFEFMPFLIYIIFLTVGPAFLSAAIYLCLARIIVVYGEGNSRYKPKTYSIVFMISDTIALILQGAGGAVAAISKDDAVKAQKGINVMIAGLAWQVASLTLFAVAAADIAFHINQGRAPLNPDFANLRASRRFKGFLWALGVATITIYIRSVYRVAELSQGFTGSIADQEIPYVIFEPVMISIAVVCQVVWHPAYVFGDMWQAADYRSHKEENEREDSDFEKGMPEEYLHGRSGSTSTFTSEKNLSIMVPPQEPRVIVHHPSCASHRRPSQFSTHHPSCSNASGQPGMMRNMSVSHKAHCPHHGTSISGPPMAPGSIAGIAQGPAFMRQDAPMPIQTTILQSQTVDWGNRNLKTPMIQQQDYSMDGRPGSRKPSMDISRGRPPKTPAKDYMPEQYATSRSLSVGNGAITPRTPLLRRESDDEREDYGATYHHAYEHEVSPHTSTFKKGRTEW